MKVVLSVLSVLLVGNRAFVVVPGINNNNRVLSPLCAEQEVAEEAKPKVIPPPKEPTLDKLEESDKDIMSMKTSGVTRMTPYTRYKNEVTNRMTRYKLREYRCIKQWRAQKKKFAAKHEARQAELEILKTRKESGENVTALEQILFEEEAEDEANYIIPVEIKTWEEKNVTAERLKQEEEDEKDDPYAKYGKTVYKGPFNGPDGYGRGERINLD